jgi:AraC family transcriptional regulator, regulatory protein of adaptative response / methylated-DNA-[protein]-cysteine methyltransferase
MITQAAVPSILKTMQPGPTHYATDEARWRAVAVRDPAAAGAFLYAVRTTGVYCRPGCSSRRPLRENVRFFGTAQEAQRAGYRACKRCLPDEEVNGQSGEPHAALIARACREIEEAEAAPGLDTLAASAGLSRTHFHRLFKRLLGVTPRQYAAAHRLRRLRDGLSVDGVNEAGVTQGKERVTDAIYGAGFGSGSRAYEAAPEALGMTPGKYRRGAPDTEIAYATAQSSLGWVLVAATARGVCAIELGDDPAALEEQLRRRFPAARLAAGDGSFAGWVAEVVALVEAPERGLALPLDVRGTAFQQRVWEALRQIPPGQTASYAQLAERIGRPTATRAVAQACGANVLAVAIPCHRVVRSGPSRAGEGLGGYRWGVERKRTLLEREAGTRALG